MQSIDLSLPSVPAGLTGKIFSTALIVVDPFLQHENIIDMYFISVVFPMNASTDE